MKFVFVRLETRFFASFLEQSFTAATSLRSFETSKKGLYYLRYTRKDDEKMVDWMIRRPRLGYGSPRNKTGSGWHKMALSFPGRTANALYDKYSRFLVKIWPLRDIKHEALRRKLENSKPIIE